MKSTLLIFLFLTSILFNNSLASKQRSSTSFIKQCCTGTSYPRLCYFTLSPYVSETRNNPKLLATKALNVALTAAQFTTKTIVRLSKLRRLKPNEASALSVCTMALANSKAQLQRSIQGMGRHSAQNAMQVSDVQTWTSTALTYAGTCMESFSGRDTNGKVKAIVQREISRLTQLTSNALALVNSSHSSGIKAHHGTHP